MNKLYLVIITLITISACTTGKKAYQQGDYDLAVTQAVNRLKSSGDNKKAKSTLRKAYKLSLATHLDNINRAEGSTDPLKWETVADNYQSINGLYNAIRKCPSCLEIVPNPAKYDTRLSAAQQKAAQVRYNLGVKALAQKQVRIKAREAHQHFEVAKRMVPRFKDVEDKLAESLYYATLKVVMEPIPSPTRLLEIRHEFFVNKINEYLHHQPINKYVQFYTSQEAENQKLEFVDHFIKIEFDRFSLGNVFQNNTEKEVSKDSVAIPTTKGKSTFRTVKAKIKISEKSISGGGVLDFKIIDAATNKVISQEKMPSEYVWTASWATALGDTRALSDEELALTKKSEPPTPNTQIMFEEFTAPLYDQIISKITSYYRNY